MDELFHRIWTPILPALSLPVKPVDSDDEEKLKAANMPQDLISSP